MSYRICKTFEVENGHMLSKHPDKCRFPHGHSRRVECILEVDELDSHEMVCDFKLLKMLAKDYLNQFDHAICLNTEDPAFSEFKERYGERVIGFQSEDPTTEILARDIFRHLEKSLSEYRADPSSSEYDLRESVRLRKVRVWETSSSWAEYERPLP